MFTADLAFLQELYRTRNELVEPQDGEVRCPACGEHFVPLVYEEETETAAPLV